MHAIARSDSFSLTFNCWYSTCKHIAFTLMTDHTLAYKECHSFTAANNSEIIRLFLICQLLKVKAFE